MSVRLFAVFKWKKTTLFSQSQDSWYFSQLICYLPATLDIDGNICTLKTTVRNCAVSSLHLLFLICVSVRKYRMNRGRIQEFSKGGGGPFPLPYLSPTHFLPPLELVPIKPARGVEERCKLP